MAEAARELGLVPSTLHRWLNDGFIAGEQLTPGAPWRIRLTDDIRALLADAAPDGWLATLEATHALRRLPPDPLATRQARRTPRRPTSAPDAGKACVSHLQPRKTDCSNPTNQQRSSMTMHPRTR